MSTGKKITSIRKISSPNTKVYDIEVEDAHHYILGDGTVSHNSYVPMKKMGGGSGLEYAASTILFLSKKKDKDKEGGVSGAIITANLKKARLTIENKKVETLLDYAEGLDPYYGLLDLAEKFEIFKKVSTRYELPDGTKVFESAILNNPEKYFTNEILDAIDEKCRDEFLYGKSNVTSTEENET